MNEQEIRDTLALARAALRTAQSQVSWWEQTIHGLEGLLALMADEKRSPQPDAATHRDTHRKAEG